MAKSGIRVDIPAFGNLHIRALCSDYTGTLSFNGELIGGVRERLCRLSQRLDIHVVTSDTRKTARAQLGGVPLAALEDEIPVDRHDEYKRGYLNKLALRSTRSLCWETAGMIDCGCRRFATAVD